MSARPLRTGYTTGACAAAAALGAARMLKEQRPLESVELGLPAGVTTTFRLQGQNFDGGRASCFVVKDAGDDPDVTHGVEVHAEVWLEPMSTSGTPAVVIEGGTGIGRVTKPGLAVPVGEWAINPVPRRMITEALLSVFAPHHSSAFAEASADRSLTIHCLISIPDGEERSRRTLNERLGIVGGLSILGTTGIVRPVSHQAWTDTIDVAIDVAIAAGSDTVVLSTGRTSEVGAQKVLARAPRPKAKESQNLLPLALRLLPEEAFIMMGDHVGHALAACRARGVRRIVLAVQFAKLVKIACGHPLTHAAVSRLDLELLAEWSRSGGLDDRSVKTIECAHTAREAFLDAPDRAALAALVAKKALEIVRPQAPQTEVAVLLIDYEGEVAGWYGQARQEEAGR